MSRYNYTIAQILSSLKAQQWTPVNVVTSVSGFGRVELVVFSAHSSPVVKFRAIPDNSMKLTQNFDDLESALRYLGFPE